MSEDGRQPIVPGADAKIPVVIERGRWTMQRENETPSEAMKRLEAGGPEVYGGSPSSCPCHGARIGSFAWLCHHGWSG